jgi:3-oxoacyl-[acyl-carrier protein] reductase
MSEETSLAASFSLSSRVALVTGASRGIGRAIALELARAGAAVALVARDRERLDDVAGLIRAFGQRAAVIVADLEHSGAASVAVQSCQQLLGEVDILVNNAGVGSFEPFDRVTDAEWRRVFSINLDAAFQLTRAVIPGMCARRWGRVINIASISGQTGGARASVAYGSSKGALIAFTKGLARDVGTAGVTVNAVAPGQIATEMSSHLSPQQVQALEAQIPVGRLGTPEELAFAVRFLASREAGYITGATLDVNGGIGRR